MFWQELYYKQVCFYFIKIKCLLRAPLELQKSLFVQISKILHKHLYLYLNKLCVTTWEKPLDRQIAMFFMNFVRLLNSRLTGVPWAAGFARRASRRSSAAVGGASAPRRSWRSCSVVAGVMADRTHTEPAGSSQSGPTTAAHSPPPTATPRHAGK